MDDNKQLNNKTILITGAGDGIGKQAAITYAQNGATVVLLGRKMRQLEKVYDDICRAGLTEPVLMPLNLTTANPDHYQEITIAIEKQFGALDGLLHNAAEVGCLTPIELYPIEQWYRLMQTNLHAPFLLTKALLPVLKLAKHASIVFTLADEQQVDRAYWGAYSISKRGLESLMHILAKELENSNIRVNAINPGPTNTKLRANTFPGEAANLHPTPKALMQNYIYLMGDDSISIHNQIIHCQK